MASSQRTSVSPRRLALLARRIQQISATVTAEALSGEDLVPLSYAVLARINDMPGIDQRRLAELVGIDPANTSYLVDGLAKEGLVLRKINGTDRRARELHPTKLGKKVRQRVQPKVLAGETKILSVLKPSERTLLFDLLARVVEENYQYARPGGGRRKRRTRSDQSDQGEKP